MCAVLFFGATYMCGDAIMSLIHFVLSTTQK